jgi:hypothetical protein
LLHQDVGDSLDALARDADLPGNPRHRQRDLQHRAEHLPPRRSEPDGSSQLLADVEQLSVQPEHRLGNAAEQFLSWCHDQQP